IRSNVLQGRKSISCANSVLPVFMTNPSPRHRRGEPPAIQIRPSNEVLKTPVRQGLTGKLGSTNRTLVTPHTRLARRSLALRPAHSRGHLFVTRIPKASATSLPP